MATTGLTAWWGRYSDPDRLELYTRWSFHLIAGCTPVAALGVLPAGTAGSTVLLLFAGFVLHSLNAGLTCSRGLDSALEQRERPRVLEGLTVLSTLGLVVLVLALLRNGVVAKPEQAATGILIAVAVGLMALSINSRTGRIVLRVGATALAVGGLTLAFGMPEEALPFAAACTLTGSGAAFAGRFSLWVLAVVRELDAARHVQTRLAVAEERLRFGRDLHDVLGRNLSVIALKSELAVQLAQRGSAAGGGATANGALDQMVEVQRIARESQQELREVVRGYRDTGLRNELAGARGVLRSAGIDCRIDAEQDRALSAAVQSALGWVVREGATNVLRHTDATRCTIRLELADEGRTAVLTVANDGVGPARGAGLGAGSGLAGLRERLALLGGTLTTRRTEGPGAPEGSGGGFVLVAEVPAAAAGPAAGRGVRRGAGPSGAGAGDAETEDREAGSR